MAEDNKRKLIAAKCPKCGQVVKFYMPEQGCVVKLKCPQQQCGHVFGVKITQKEIHLGNGATQQQQGESHPVTDPIVNTGGTPSGVIARLLQKKKHFYNKDKFHELHLGANTIGMFDPQSPSDIMIEGDRTISHRSVTITVESVGSSYKYLFSVNRSKILFISLANLFPRAHLFISSQTRSLCLVELVFVFLNEQHDT